MKDISRRAEKRNARGLGPRAPRDEYQWIHLAALATSPLMVTGIQSLIVNRSAWLYGWLRPEPPELGAVKHAHPGEQSSRITTAMSHSSEKQGSGNAMRHRF